MGYTDTECEQMSSDNEYEAKKKKLLKRLTDVMERNDYSELGEIEQELKKLGITASFHYASKEKK